LKGRHRALVRPYARAVVFSYDEKTQCQALDRTRPSLPLKPCRAGTMIHDYKRNGTIEVFAAMNIATVAPIRAASGAMHSSSSLWAGGSGFRGLGRACRRPRRGRGPNGVSMRSGLGLLGGLAAGTNRSRS